MTTRKAPVITRRAGVMVPRINLLGDLDMGKL